MIKKANVNVLKKLKSQSKQFKAKIENNISSEEENKILRNYSIDLDVEDKIKEFLEQKTLELHNVSTKMYNELGRIFSETQKELSNNKDGIFERWYRQLGFKKQTVYRFINRWEYIVTNWDNKKLIENLPISLSYELSNPNCLEKLKIKILNGEITSLKEYKEAKSLIEYKDNSVEILEAFDYTSFDTRYKALFKDVSQKFEKLTLNEKIKIEKMLKTLEDLLN